MSKHYNIGENHPKFIKGITRNFLIREYSINKKSQEQLSKEIGYSTKVIRNRLIKYNIPIRTMSEIKRGKPNLKIRGKYSGKYVDGRSNFPYPLEFNEKLKGIVRKRDNYTCQGENCSMTEEEHIIVYGRDLEIHHIDYNKQNCNEDNLITTCKQCNIRANYNRDYWFAYFTYMMEEYYVR